MIAWIGFLCISFFIFRSMHMPLICGVFFFRFCVRFSSFASLFFGLCVSCSTQRRSICCSSVRTAMMPWHWSHFRWESLFFFLTTFFSISIRFAHFIYFACSKCASLFPLYQLFAFAECNEKSRLFFTRRRSLVRIYRWWVYRQRCTRIPTDPVTHNITEHNWKTGQSHYRRRSLFILRRISVAEWRCWRFQSIFVNCYYHFFSSSSSHALCAAFRCSLSPTWILWSAKWTEREKKDMKNKNEHLVSVRGREFADNAHSHTVWWWTNELAVAMGMVYEFFYRFIVADGSHVKVCTLCLQATLVGLYIDMFV